MLSSSDCQSRTIAELLELEPDAHERLLECWCGYTESPGAPALRRAIASSALTRIRVGSGAVAATIGVGGGPVAHAANGGDVWVAAGVAAGARSVGGTLRVLSDAPPPSIDPALLYPQMQAQFSAATYDTLVTFQKTGGSTGLQLVPDLALAAPTVSAGGTVYTFTLRPGCGTPPGGRCARRISGMRSSGPGPEPGRVLLPRRDRRGGGLHPREAVQPGPGDGCRRHCRHRDLPPDRARSRLPGQAGLRVHSARARLHPGPRHRPGSRARHRPVHDHPVLPRRQVVFARNRYLREWSAAA